MNTEVSLHSLNDVHVEVIPWHETKSTQVDGTEMRAFDYSLMMLVARASNTNTQPSWEDVKEGTETAAKLLQHFHKLSNETFRAEQGGEEDRNYYLSRMCDAVTEMAGMFPGNRGSIICVEEFTANDNEEKRYQRVIPKTTESTLVFCSEPVEDPEQVKVSTDLGDMRRFVHQKYRDEKKRQCGLCTQEGRPIEVAYSHKRSEHAHFFPGTDTASQAVQHLSDVEAPLTFGATQQDRPSTPVYVMPSSRHDPRDYPLTIDPRQAFPEGTRISWGQQSTTLRESGAGAAGGLQRGSESDVPVKREPFEPQEEEESKW